MRIFQNLRYKLLALVVAMLLWGMARGTGNVEKGFDIPIAFQSVPEELVIVDRSTDEVNIRVRGSRAALGNVSPEALDYRLDLAGAKEGAAAYEIDVTPIESDLPRGAKIVSRSPSSLEVTFERRGTKVVRVRPDLEGDPAEGFRVAAMEVQPDRVRITGARSEVLRLNEVITESVSLAGLTEPIDREVRLLVGGRNAWVEQPATVRVRVQVVPLPPPPPEEPSEAEPGEGDAGGEA